MKYIDVLGRKGCSRTALEFFKLLFGLNPEEDSHGVMLRFDYYSIRAKEHKNLLSFIENLSFQVYPGADRAKVQGHRLMPNFLMTSALASRTLGGAEEFKNQNECLDQAVKSIAGAVESGDLVQLFDSEWSPSTFAERQIILCLMLYPSMMRSLVNKIAKKQISQKFQKSFYVEYQKQSWKQILTHSTFEDAECNYDWVVSPKEKELAGGDENVEKLAEESAEKVFNIFIERSGGLFDDDQTLMWLRETIGYALHSLDEGLLPERDLVVAQLQSGIVDVHFYWSRYRLSLKTADFMEDLSIVNPQDLLVGP